MGGGGELVPPVVLKLIVGEYVEVAIYDGGSFIEDKTAHMTPSVIYGMSGGGPTYFPNKDESL